VNARVAALRKDFLDVQSTEASKHPDAQPQREQIE